MGHDGLQLSFEHATQKTLCKKGVPTVDDVFNASLTFWSLSDHHCTRHRRGMSSNGIFSSRRSALVYVTAALFVVAVATGGAALIGFQERVSLVLQNPITKPVDDGKLSIPYPGSTLPHEVIENVKSIAEQLRLDLVTDNPDVTMKTVKLMPARILSVRSDAVPEGYLVVELSDSAGNPSATIAYGVNGTFMAIRDARGQSYRKSLDLSEAFTRVQARVKHAVRGAEYVFFPNVAEPGGSIFAPLVQVSTDVGNVYLNSEGAAYTDDASPLSQELHSGAVLEPAKLSKRLRPVGAW
jgi:hypothetical protein